MHRASQDQVSVFFCFWASRFPLVHQVTIPSRAHDDETDSIRGLRS